MKGEEKHNIEAGNTIYLLKMRRVASRTNKLFCF